VQVYRPTDNMLNRKLMLPLKITGAVEPSTMVRLGKEF